MPGGSFTAGITLYPRQHHADADRARLGELTAEHGTAWAERGTTW